jgi:hypothetical protein
VENKVSKNKMRTGGTFGMKKPAGKKRRFCESSFSFLGSLF